MTVTGCECFKGTSVEKVLVLPDSVCCTAVFILQQSSYSLFSIYPGSIAPYTLCFISKSASKFYINNFPEFIPVHKSFIRTANIMYTEFQKIDLKSNNFLLQCVVKLNVGRRLGSSLDFNTSVCFHIWGIFLLWLEFFSIDLICKLN